MQRPSRAERGIVLRHMKAPPDIADVCPSIFERQDTVALGPAIDFPGVSPLLHIVFNDDCGVRNFGKGGPFEAVPSAAIWGSQTCVHEMRFGGPMFVISAVLTFDGASRLTGRPVSALLDQCVTLDDAGLRSLDLRSRLFEAQSFAQRAEILFYWLRHEIGSRRRKSVGHELEVLASGRMQGSIASIAKDLGVTPRGLHKRAIREVGLSPKTILRYARLQAALRHCHPNPPVPADAADLLMQFHDQSHFSAEFRKLTGLTPREYRRAKQNSGDKLPSMVYLETAPLIV